MLKELYDDERGFHMQVRLGRVLECYRGRPALMGCHQQLHTRMNAHTRPPPTVRTRSARPSWRRRRRSWRRAQGAGGALGARRRCST